MYFEIVELRNDSTGNFQSTSSVEILGFGTDELDGDDADAVASVADAPAAAAAAAAASAASLSAFAASGTHRPESTHRFKWYLASSSGILPIASCSKEISRLSKHFCRAWNDRIET